MIFWVLADKSSMNDLGADINKTNDNKDIASFTQ
ncbi:hypothetical protein MHK_002641 [Candidatus Magnetomorum sp. HK-1]|jgi:hypothetical protein|nr:hypothetical protein MHK_002641 [Candidatus Magnetomorum sp. HK-1]